MNQVTIAVEDSLYTFYQKIGQNAGGLSPEKVMADALFKLAGELSCNAIYKKTRKKTAMEGCRNHKNPEEL